MKHARKILAAATIVVLLGTSASSVLASGTSNTVGQRNNPKVGRFATELNLSDEQLQRIEEIESAQEIQTVEMRAGIKVAEIELRDMMREQNANESAVIVKVEEIGGLKTALRVANVRSKLAINKILTPEQLQTLRSLDRQRGKRDKNRRHGKKPGREDLRGIDGR